MFFDYTTVKFALGASMAIPFYVAVAFDNPALYYATLVFAAVATGYLYRHAQPKKMVNGNVRVGKITVPVMYDIPRSNLGVMALVICAYCTYMTAVQPVDPLIGDISEFVINRLGINANILLQSAVSAGLFVSGLEMVFEKEV